MKEKDIRPQALFDQYLEIAASDAVTFFSDVERVRISCPACANEISTFRFTKFGFNYEECQNCQTLFVNPRPDAAAFDRYYKDAPSVRFWATDFYRQTAEARRKAMFEPRAKMVMDIAETHHGGQSLGCLVDIGAGYGIFCEEIAKLVNGKTGVLAIEPSEGLKDVCESKGIKVLPVFLSQVSPQDLPANGVRLATSFELLEHLHDPLAFIKDCGKLVGSGGLLVMTTLNGLGFDLVLLGEHSKSIYPPHHINLFNPASAKILLDRAGFDLLEVTTPGKLDVEIAERQKEMIDDKFARQILEADSETKEEFQSFLQRAKLSSHMMMVARCR